MIKPKDEEKVREQLLIVGHELEKKISVACEGNEALIEKYYANIYIHKTLMALIAVAVEWPLVGFVYDRINQVAKKSCSVQLDANYVWKTFRNSFLGNCDWYEKEIEKRLLLVKREIKAEILKECVGDLLKREKYCAELVSASRFEDLDEIKNDWPLSRLVAIKMNNVAKSDPYPLDVHKVWQIFRRTFLGRNNLLEAEIVARRLLWRMAIKLESVSLGHEKELAVIDHVSGLSDLKNLSETIEYRYLTSRLLDELRQNTHFAGTKNENPSTITTEAWYRFRRLLSKYRSQVYSMTP